MVLFKLSLIFLYIMWPLHQFLLQLLKNSTCLLDKPDRNKDSTLKADFQILDLHKLDVNNQDVSVYALCFRDNSKRLNSFQITLQTSQTMFYNGTLFRGFVALIAHSNCLNC